MTFLFFDLCYLLFLLTISPVIFYRVLVLGKYRDGLGEKFLGHVPILPEPSGKRIWFHAVSVGEVNLLRPLIRMISIRCPDWECVISSTSATGHALAQKLYGGTHVVFYCPLDFSFAVRNAVRRIKPGMLVLAEQEIWPNMLGICRKNRIPVALINGRFSEAGYKRLKRIRGLWQRVMRKIDLAAVQSETYAAWFRDVGANSDAVHVTGSMKFDGVGTDRGNPVTQSLVKLAGITPDDIVFLAGSTQEPEEESALKTYLALRKDWPHLRLILVPRHPERFESVAEMLERYNTVHTVSWSRRSQLSEPQKAGEVLLVDTVGELGAWWGTAKIAFVGGSMGSRGGQNMLEPAAYGAAVCFGPNTKNFRDIVEILLADEAAVVVHDESEMQRFVQQCLENPAFAEMLGTKAKSLVFQHLGATEKTLNLLKPFLTPHSHNSSPTS
ncbi:MAG: 3-deoxy-D-manno-octulosonic acid transferase [Planctomycetaceae bacterium]|jgi:3-deoxy-D-manno-octulosonic-acid transferase|nr:3-deoxy-D-manno-octulosonic acid transferase [Planctomycetaceae bacterium]